MIDAQLASAQTCDLIPDSKLYLLLDAEPPSHLTFINFQ